VLYIQNFNLKENKFKEYQRFIKENEEILVKHAPKGWKYRGLYIYVLGFGLYHGAIIWEFSDYSGFDALRNHDDPKYWNFVEQAMTYGTSEPVPAWLL
jgi:hypothetical protein